MKYAWIKENSDSFPVKAMCRAMAVSKSGYYRWLSSKPGPRAERSRKIRNDVRQLYEESNQIYGSYKITERLKSCEQLESACRNTVAKAMNEMGLQSKVSKKFKPTTTVTDPSKQPAPNLLDHSFEYIETFYNSRRIHQTLGYRSPDEFEAEHETNLAA